MAADARRRRRLSPTARTLCTASISQRAVRSSRASSPFSPTSCTPIGMPEAPVSKGKVTAGTPQSVQVVQNTGLPVEPRPLGASPGAAGVRIAS